MEMEIGHFYLAKLTKNVKIEIISNTKQGGPTETFKCSWVEWQMT
jgi:hypothetical protein